MATPNFPSFYFGNFTDGDVRKSLTSISSNAVGVDSIGKKMIIPIIEEISPVITHLMNFSISSGTFPSIWKDAQVTPLPKKSKPVSFSDFRPICILPFLSKVLERLVHQQLGIFLNSNNLFNPFQSGFRPGHSTTSALVKVTDDIRDGMAKGLVTILTLLDFSSAFNNVDFDVLLSVLRTLNLSSSAILWFRSYLVGRRQRINVDDNFSTWCQLCAGVPQGGVLSPLLFAIFINSISQNLSSSYHLYADDLQIYTSAHPSLLDEAIDRTNADLNHILQWSTSHGLKVNPSKTQIITFGNPRTLSRVDWDHLPKVLFDGVPLVFSNSVKNLGIRMDKHLSWEPQLAEVSRKIYASSASLRRLRNFLPTATKISLSQSLLLPLLDYADASYPDLTQAQLDKLERFQNLCIRFIFGLRKYDHITEYRDKLKWLPIRFRRDAHFLFLLYNILFQPNTPTYLKERFQYLHQSHSCSLRSTHTLQLKTPTHSFHSFNSSFTVRAIKLWNALPTDIRKAKTIHTFKNLVYKHYLQTQQKICF